MNIKCKNILLKGSSAVLLSLLSLIFIGISSAKAWEICGNPFGIKQTWYGHYDIGNEMLPCSTFQQTDSLYFYNKCNLTGGDWTNFEKWVNFEKFSNSTGGTHLGNTGDWVITTYPPIGKDYIYYDTTPYTGTTDYCRPFVQSQPNSFSNSLDENPCFCMSNIEPGTTPPEPEPETSAYILYYGSNPYYVGINGTTTLQVVYNICDSWNEQKSYSMIIANPADETNLLFSGATQELTGCSGAFNLRITAPEEELSNYATINILEDETTAIVKSNAFLFSVITTINTTNSWVHFIFENPAYIQAGTETTAITYAQFLTDGLQDNTEICIIEKDKNNLKTEACEDGEAGIDYKEIALTVPDFQATKIISLGLYDKTTGNLLLESESTMLIIYNNSAIEDEWNNQFSATGTSAFLGLNSYDMACSQENWTSTSTFLGINFTKSLCETKKFGLDILFISGTTVQKTIMSTGDMLSYTFPFGLYRNIVDSWNESANQPMPEDLKWLIPINTNGDITINLPPNLTNGTSTEIIVFGKTIFEQEGTPADQMFKNIRALSTYLLWVGFLLGLGYLATDIYIEIKKEKTK